MLTMRCASAVLATATLCLVSSLALAAAVTSTAPTSVPGKAKPHAPSPQQAASAHHLGSGVRFSGDFAVAAASLESNLGELESGAAYVYERGDEWTPVQKLIPSMPSIAERFGTAVAIDGDRIAIAAPGYLIGTGAVYLFERDARQQPGEQWVEAATLFPSDPKPGLRFGGGLGMVDSVAIDGEVIVVGAPLAPAGGKEAAGKVYLFHLDEDSGEYREAAILSSGSAASEHGSFGYAVALRSGVLFVGAPGEDESRGAVHVFAENATGEWQRVAHVTAPKPAAGNRFGAAIRFDGDRLVAGAPGANSAFTFAAASGDVHSWKLVGDAAWRATNQYRNEGRQMPAAEVVQRAAREED